MVGALSKLPEVQAGVVLPKLLRTVERSVRSTWPSRLASPRSSGETRREWVSTGCQPKVVKGVVRTALSATAMPKLAGMLEVVMPVGLVRPKMTWLRSVGRALALVALLVSRMSLLLLSAGVPVQLLVLPVMVREVSLLARVPLAGTWTRTELTVRLPARLPAMRVPLPL